jgi:hypothetical protein
MSDQFRTYCLKFLLAAFAVVTFSAGSQSIAQDAAWRVSKATGDVTISASGAQPVALTDAASLNPGDVIRTGANGRVLLLRGAESMLITANTVVGLPKEQKDGLSTTILQQAGTILLEVEKRNIKHFQVETPFLAAVVKGTQFRVTVDKDDSRVDVLRGQVEVVDFKSGQYTQVFPDQSAKVSALGTGGLSLSGAGIFSPIQQGTPRKSSITPTPMMPMPQARSAAADSAPNGQSIWAPVPRNDSDTTRYSSHMSESGWGERITAMVKNIVSPDPRAGRGGYSTFDFALPVAAGFVVALGVAIGRRRKGSQDRRDR